MTSSTHIVPGVEGEMHALDADGAGNPKPNSDEEHLGEEGVIERGANRVKLYAAVRSMPLRMAFSKWVPTIQPRHKK